ncbi:hypothetical protein JVT61DRAFT_6198 [Boletus reticuloceps]|uniref:Uncharacterized protein n=1 Tax=Boletus reticuloceps TaxID=495285 RepID=A0A8I2YK21_9AGAM|nr:hypothetical protein JVT61DRAFT_6198 [Boletus reticuloceps]
MSHRVGHTHSAASDTDQRSRSISHTRSAADDTHNMDAPISSHLRGAAVPPPPTDSNSLPTVRSASFGVHTDNADPSQLGFYPPPVRDVIERMKQISHCNLASLNSFPLHPQFNTKASEYINEAIIERQSRGLVVPEGKYIYCYGHTNNLAHPALAGLVVDFFYTTPNSVGSLFPEVFGNQVPIKLTLDKVAAEGKEVVFKCDIYADVYVDILGLMVKCDTTPIHQAKTKALRVQWAKLGRQVLIDT